MTVNELIENLNFEVINKGDGDKQINGCYCSDLLSHCMSNIDEGNIWVTVQTNINVVAIAVLTELSCIIISQNMPMDQAVIDKAKSENVTILRTADKAYELCVKIGNLI